MNFVSIEFIGIKPLREWDKSYMFLIDFLRNKLFKYPKNMLITKVGSISYLRPDNDITLRMFYGIKNGKYHQNNIQLGFYLVFLGQYPYQWPP